MTSHYGNWNDVHNGTVNDDMKITGGSYRITCALDAVEANDSISIYDGAFTITTNDPCGYSDSGHVGKEQSEAKRLVNQGGITENGSKATDAYAPIALADLKNGIIIRKGKKVFRIFIVAE